MRHAERSHPRDGHARGARPRHGSSIQTMTRPWTSFYPAETSRDLPPVPWPHLPALLREAAGTYAALEAFTLFLPNGTRGGLTFADVDRLSDHLAVYLRERSGFSPGERVALQMPNCLAYPVAVFGCLKAGLVIVNTNPLYTTSEMTYQFVDSGATGLVVIDLFADRVADVLPKTAIRTVLLVSIADLLPRVTALAVKAVQRYVKRMRPEVRFEHVHFSAALAEGRRLRSSGRDARAYEGALTHASVAVLQYTGGTTGVAKGAVLTHGNLLTNIAQSLEMWKPWLSPGREVILTVLPLYHIFAFTANLMLFVAAGGRNILVPSPRPLTNLRKVMLRERITWFTGVNTLFNGLMQEPWFQAKKDWALRGSIAGGMALAPAVGDRWEAMTRTPIYQGYGLSESSPVVTLNPFQRSKRGSIGVPLPGTDVRIVDEQGTDVPVGHPGELLIRGPQVMREYWRQPEETARALRGGWLATGDVTQMDEEGYLTVVDRKKDMIVVSGFNVYPNEVEATLATCPGIVDAAVVGVPEASGEVVCAFVVRNDPSVTEERVRQHCRASLTNYKVPKRVIFAAELPKSAVGKVLRKDLRAAAPKEDGREHSSDA